MSTIPPILTITGSDSTGGSGVQADIRTVTELGGYAVSAITSITVQNTLGIQEFFDVPAEIVAGQIEAIMNDIQPQIVKVGMIRQAETLDAVVGAIAKYRPQTVIYTPVLWSSNGDSLMSAEMLDKIRRRLLPLCSLVVARKRESDIVLGQTGNGKGTPEPVAPGARTEGGPEVFLLDNANTHGMTNRFSSALAVYLAQGKSPAEALAAARDAVNAAMARENRLQGRCPELYNAFVTEVVNRCHTYSDVRYYADRLNVGCRYLAQVTHRMCGKTPKAIIDEYTAKEAERELATTTRTIQEIAYGFGFSSQAHFSKFFKKMRGISPSDYRRKSEV